MSLVREIQQDAISNDVRLPSLLRKCLVLAARLGSDEFRDWTRSELYGYSDEAELPSYRLLHTQIHGTLETALERRNDVPLHTFNLDEDIRENLTTTRVREPIASIEMLTQTSDRILRSAIPAELVALISRQYPRGSGCLRAYKAVAVNDLIGILDTVRTRVLDFALEIESKYPDTAESDSALSTEPTPQTISQIFLTIVMGDNAGSLNIGNRAEQHVTDSSVGAIAQGENSSAEDK